MKSKKDQDNSIDLKERPLKGLKEMINQNVVLFKDNPSNKQMSQQKLKKFKEMRKWDIELERLDREEVTIKNSLKEINLRITDAVNKKLVARPNQSKNPADDTKEKVRINLSLTKIKDIIKKAQPTKKL